MEEAGAAVRMAGYLEKRGKLKLMSNWKKYWFVLEGQLLLYYKSQLEYINLSACRGSLNIGIASNVRPGHGLTIQVETRTQCMTLRTKERALQEQWLQALLDSMALPNTLSLKRQSTGTQHFRYSLDNLPAINEQDDESLSKGLEKKSTLPRRVTRRDSIVHRLRKMGGVSYANRSDNVPLKTPRLEAAHKLLSKSLSASMIQTEKAQLGGSQDIQDVQDQEKSPTSLQTNNTFQNNLMMIHSHLQETYKRDADANMSTPSSNNKADVLNNTEVNEEYISTDDNQATKTTTITEVNTEYMTNIPLQDENQNSCVLTENTLYEETITESNYCYDSLKTIERNTQDYDDKVYYSSYDRMGLVRGIQQDEVEPDLPPRPIHDGTMEEYKPVSEYEEVTLVQCASTKTEAVERKHSSFRDKILLKDFRHQKLFKKTSKDKTIEQSEIAQVKKKRKPSFLKKFMKHKKEVPTVDTEQVPSESEEEPEYESVCFQADQSVPAYDGFQMQPFMHADTMLELKNRLQNKNSSEGDSEDYETIGSITEDRVPSLAENITETDLKNTMPPSLATSAEHLYATSRKSQSRNSLKVEVPSLPPRCTNRPPSPWHDVPTNNSLVCDAPFKILLNHTANSAEENLINKQVVSFQIVPDEMLNTPQGIRAIKSKWQQVAKTCEWSREQQQVTFPNHGKTSCESLNTFSEHQNTHALINNSNITECIENDDNEPDSLERTNVELECKDFDQGEETQICDMLTIEIDSSVEVRNHVSVQPSDVEICNLVDLSTNHTLDVKQEGMDRYSDELHLLLAQLAEITSAPLFHIGATKSLLMPVTTTLTTLDKELGPIRRRRHSDPDYDVPRPHVPPTCDAPDTSMSPDSLEPQLCAADAY